MLRENHDKSTVSWLSRALAGDARLSGEHSHAEAVVNPHAGNTRDDSGPCEVWLRNIGQPRRMRERDESLK